MKVLAPRSIRQAGLFLLFSLPAAVVAGSTVAETRAVVEDVSADSLLPAPAFDEGVAREIVKLTEAAYCTGQLVKWNCSVCQSSFPGMRDVTLLQGQARNVRGFVGVDHGATSTSHPADTAKRRQIDTLEGDGDERGALQGDGVLLPSGESKRRIVITFSGTDPKSIKNWIDDLEAAPIAHAYQDHCEDCKVHRGFLAAYQAVQDQIRAVVADHLRENPGAEILITGHSLGGALAALCFLDLQVTLGLGLGSHPVPFAPVYIFGAPRVGNEAFATFAISHGVPIYRVVHHRDPVPHVPFEVWGYRHPPTEAFFNADQTSYMVCDDSGEDLACSDQFWVISGAMHVSDHLWYLEVDYTMAYLNCFMSGDGDQGKRKELPAGDGRGAGAAGAAALAAAAAAAIEAASAPPVSATRVA
ncbi:unnamed protein product [Scytosiphon promiscuus]